MLLFSGETDASYDQEPGFPLAHPDVFAAQPYYDQLVEATGCSGLVDTLVCLCNASYDVLIPAVIETPNFFSYQHLNFAWGLGLMERQYLGAVCVPWR